MSFTPVVEYEEGDESLVIGYGRHDNFMAVMDGFSGLETVIQFTDVEFTRHKVEFKYSPFTDRYVEATVVSIERQDFGEVTEFLEEFQLVVNDHRDPMELVEEWNE